MPLDSPIRSSDSTYRVRNLMGSMAAFAQTVNGNIASASPAAVRVTQILGFAGKPGNAKGKLSIQGDTLQFERKKAAAARVEIASIDNVVLGEESKQLGGMPMTLGKAAAPYGGGRVVSLFSHKKFDAWAELRYRYFRGDLKHKEELV
jgi:hypothetical protein